MLGSGLIIFIFVYQLVRLAIPTACCLVQDNNIPAIDRQLVIMLN